MDLPSPVSRTYKQTSSSGSAVESGKEPRSNLWIDPAEYQLRKILPPRLTTRKNDVYVTRRTDFKAQECRCKKLLDSGDYEEIYVHGLGAAINRAINLSLQLQRKSGGLIELEVATSTVEVTDEMQPLLDDLEPKYRTRFLSAIHIRIFRKL